MKSTHTRFAIVFSCGAPGSGKSYAWTRDVIDRLINDANVIITTNLPLNIAEIAVYVASKTAQTVDEVTRRIDLIDREVLSRWKKGNGGPWELAEKGLSNGRDFILDECHNYCSKRQKARHQQWEEWLGEARHESWRRIVFITQDESKVGAPIKDHAELRYELTNSEMRRDPYLRIPMAYWYELAASFSGEYRASIALTEYRRINGRLREQHTERFTLDPFWFAFYNSYEATGGGTGQGQAGAPIVRQWEKRPRWFPKRKEGQIWLPTWLWFFRTFKWRFSAALAVASFMFWVGPLGGHSTLMKGWINGVILASGSKRTPEKTAVSEAGEGGESAAAETTSPEPSLTLRDVLLDVPDEYRQVILGELREAALEVVAAQDQVAKIERDRASERRRHTVVALTKDQAWFTDPPCSCQVGKQMSEGPYSGLMVKRISVDEGWVELDGGIQLWVGRMHPGRMPGDESKDAAVDDAVAGDNGRRELFRPREFSGAVPAPSGGTAGPERAAPGESPDFDHSGRNDAARLHPESSVRSVLVRRDGRRVGPQDADAGSAGPAD